MTTQELIEQLSKFPPDTPVVIRGYESGYNDVQEVNPQEMQLNINTIWYYGAHGDNNHQSKPIEGIPMTPVVCLYGTNHITDEKWHGR